jgi:7,8-dihydro-6-hydroxymethylpterin-pyrophosphokinase (HPPK)
MEQFLFRRSFLKLSNPRNPRVRFYRPTETHKVSIRQRSRTASLEGVKSGTKTLGEGIQDVAVDATELGSNPFVHLGSSSTGKGSDGPEQVSAVQQATLHRAMIGLGSNIGDRVAMIEQACQKMLEHGIKVKATSSLYETAPMYVTDQATFYNGVCEVRNRLWAFGGEG